MTRRNAALRPKDASEAIEFQEWRTLARSQGVVIDDLTGPDTDTQMLRAILHASPKLSGFDSELHAILFNRSFEMLMSETKVDELANAKTELARVQTIRQKWTQLRTSLAPRPPGT